ncbi:MAG: Bax inhibitor-1/YccA family protein [Granulosicoccus sp.]
MQSSSPQSGSPITRTGPGVLETNKVLRNTYALLSMTLLFAAAMAAVSTMMDVPRSMAMIAMVASFVLIFFVLPKTQDSSAGIAVVFLLTGLLGFSLGPMLSSYLNYANGSRLIGTALGGTGTIFLGLSAYVLTTKKDFSFMGGMLFVGILVVIAAMFANIFLKIPAMSVAMSGAIVLLMSGFILFDTSRILHGGETNYVRATVSLFLNIFNLFTSLLHLLGIMGDD